MSFHFYGLIIGLGAVLGIGVIEKLLKESWEEELWWGMVLWVMGLGLVGARVYHVIDYWEYYGRHLEEIVMVGNGGMGIIGGIMGGGVGLAIFSCWQAKKLKKDWRKVFFSFADVLVVGLSLAQAVGRWANYANDELWGKISSLGFKHPIFLYESLLDLSLFLVLRGVYQRKRRGEALGVYLVGYGLIRIMLDPLRERSWLVGSVGMAQIIGAIMVIVGLLILSKKRR